MTPFTAHQALPYLIQYREKSPLIHCLTNDVVQNFTANLLLASGGVPAMIPAVEEAAEFTTIASALLINVGTVTTQMAEAMLLSAKTAHDTGTPWVLDPVAIGPALYFRSGVVHDLLTFKPTVIRGNPAEILVLAGKEASAQGPDSKESIEAGLQAAKEVAREFKTIVAVTGEKDYITDGERGYIVEGGTALLTKITGAGCALSALVAGFIGSSMDTLEATAAASFYLKMAGEWAEKASAGKGSGSFAVAYLDAISQIMPEDLLALSEETQ